MTTLFIDAGNTNVKWRLGEAGDMQNCAFDDPGFRGWVRSNQAAISSVAISSVQSEQWNLKLEDLCDELDLTCWFAKSDAENQGLISAYSQPDNLGVDRWLALLALWCRLKKGFVLVDSGTALTLDVVDNGGQHLGGYILPGLALQRRALLDASERLDKLVSTEPKYQVELGRDTSEAIDQGIFASAVALIEKLMKNAELSSDCLVFTGGSAAQLQQAMNQSHLEDDLVMQGLSLAYAYTQEQAQTGMELNKI